jgi:hypothetical protein
MPPNSPRTRLRHGPPRPTAFDRLSDGHLCGCRTNQRRLRLLVRLPQGHGLGAQHFGCGEALVPVEQLSRGQQKWLLSNSYSGPGLSDSHSWERQCANDDLRSTARRTVPRIENAVDRAPVRSAPAGSASTERLLVAGRSVGMSGSTSPRPAVPDHSSPRQFSELASAQVATPTPAL